MKDIMNFDINASRLAACLRQIDQLSMEAVISIDDVASSSLEPRELIHLNELATSLELMQSQMDYYFPDACGLVDGNEWSDALAVLNSSAEWIEGQVLELEVFVAAKALSDRLHTLSLAYIEAIPHMIATRLAKEEVASQHTARSFVTESRFVNTL